MITAAVMLSLTACGDTTWIAKVDGEVINSGAYIYYQGMGYSAAGYELAKEDQNYYYYMMYGMSYIDEKIGDKTVKEYMNDYALDMCKQYVVVERLFDELGLTISEEEQSLIDIQVNNMWNNDEAQYKKIGISKETLQKVTENSYKEGAVFEKYYEVGGLNGTTEEDIKAYLEDNYARVKYITFAFSDSYDDAVDSARKDAALATAQSYLDRANAGEDMNLLIEEYQAILAAENAEENENTEDSESADEQQTPSDSEEPENAEDAEADETETEDVEENPYKNEYIIGKENSVPSDKFTSYVFGNVKTGEFSIVQDDLNFYLVQKLDILERPDVYEQNRSALLQALFDSDYTALINNRLKDYSVEINQKSVKRYKPETAVNAGD